MITRNPAALPPLRTDIEAHLAHTRDYIARMCTRPAEEMADFFTVRGDGYDEHMQQFAACYDVTASFIPANATDILDLGCGTGLELDALDRICKRENRAFPHVVGIDMTRALTDQLLAKHPDKDIALRHGSYFSLPLGERCFDCAVSVESLHHFSYDEKIPLFGRVLNALKPGGIFLQCDYFASCEEEVRMCEEHYRIRRAMNGTVTDADFVHIDRPRLPAEEGDALLRAGFASVTYVTCGVEGTLLLVARKDA